MAFALSVSRLVLDTWPVLEWIKNREPASQRFREILRDTVATSVSLAMRRINYGEVIYTIRKAPDIYNRDQAVARFRMLPIVVHSVDDALVDEAVELKSQYAFAYADAFAAALAIRFGLPLVTGDREFRSLEVDGLLELRWVGA